MAADPLSDKFFALADPTRRQLLARLADGDATVNELAEPFAMSLPAVSKHLKILERSGLIDRARVAQARPCHLNRDALEEVTAWLEAYEQSWQQNFDRLATHLKQMQQPETKPTNKGN